MSDTVRITFQGSAEERDQLAREAAELLDGDEEFRRFVRLVTVPVEPGRMGGLAEALEIVGAVEPILTAAVGALGYWLGQRATAAPVTFEVRQDGVTRRITVDEASLDEALRRFEDFAAGRSASDEGEGDVAGGDPVARPGP
ncbi:hypothetical protein [Streptomyces sp. HSG2]|uniref:effector-associated constant component EACC1 n=1 Tax=Streptomyces sp. HSG2 TaxID=2797167 RepID=UPI0019084CD4|nr:hypothetical protein [Streptomyces sp. HSG2]